MAVQFSILVICKMSRSSARNVNRGVSKQPVMWETTERTLCAPTADSQVDSAASQVFSAASNANSVPNTSEESLQRGSLTDHKQTPPPASPEDVDMSSASLLCPSESPCPLPTLKLEILPNVSHETASKYLVQS